jgi:hypothetical protein
VIAAPVLPVHKETLLALFNTDESCAPHDDLDKGRQPEQRKPIGLFRSG